MSSTVRRSDVPRDRPDWMRPIDEPLLEHLREMGHGSPSLLEDEGVTVANHASNRLSELADHGLVERVRHGIYRITELGERFLDQETEPGELENGDRPGQ